MERSLYPTEDRAQSPTMFVNVGFSSLKLIEKVVGETPILLLLLDDVLAELDPSRQNQLLETIGDRFQTLITTTHLSCFDSVWLKNSQIFSVEGGKLSDF